MFPYMPTAETSPAPLSPTLGEACRRWPERPAVTFEGSTITYAELWRRVAALAAAYERMGVGAGDRVLCQLRNSTELIVAIGAAWARGAAHVGADNDLTGRELSRLVERLGAAALVYQPPRQGDDPFAALRTVTAEHPGLDVVVHGPAADGHASMAALTSAPGSAAALEVDPLDPAIIFLTSGTTGEPKAVVEPFAAHWAKMQLFTDHVRPGPDDVMLLPLPVSHVFGQRLALLTLLRGGRLVLVDRFSPDRVLDLVRVEQVTVLPGVPTHLRLLHDRYDPARHDLGTLRWVLSAAANLPRALAEWVLRDLGARMLFVFGCSEGFTTVSAEAEDILAGSVGRAVFEGPPGTPSDGTVGIMDPDTGAFVPDGDTGEIVFGARLPVRYWDQPPVAVDGWYHTGDLGHVDEQGRLHVTGRLKELINRGGLHVSASEVELAMVRHPAIADGAAIPMQDRVLGEAVCACIVPAGPRAPDLAELREFLATDLARHKLPDELCVVDSIPRTVIGKVDRRALAARVGELQRERLRSG